MKKKQEKKTEEEKRKRLKDDNAKQINHLKEWKEEERACKQWGNKEGGGKEGDVISRAKELLMLVVFEVSNYLWSVCWITAVHWQSVTEGIQCAALCLKLDLHL